MDEFPSTCRDYSEHPITRRDVSPIGPWSNSETCQYLQRIFLLEVDGLLPFDKDHGSPRDQCGDQKHPEECFQERGSHHREEQNAPKDAEPQIGESPIGPY